jgi:molecular chaperone DnaK (HSP70)
MRRVLGIDFGTTNSSVAIYPPIMQAAEQDRAELLGPWDYQSPYECLLPTRVLLRQNGPALVPYSQEEEESAGNGFAMNNFKPFLNERHLRRVFYETTYEMDLNAPPSSLDGSQVKKAVSRPKLEKASCTRAQLMEATTAVLSALLKQKQVAAHWREVDRIAIGVPAAYGIVARHRLLECMYRTGLFRSRREVVQKVTFVPEPVAISVGAPSSGSAASAAPDAEFDPFADDAFDPFQPAAAAQQSSASKRVLIFDFGGGTLDLALVLATTDALGYLVPNEVVAVGGPDADIGGRHFDEYIYNYVVRKHGRVQVAKAEVLPHIEEAKIALSRNEVEPLLWGARNVTLTRQEVDDAVQPVLQKSAEAIHEFLDGNKIDVSSIDLVLPAGGMSLMPAVFDLLVRQFGKERVIQWGPKIVHEDRTSQRILAATSIGAAMYAHAIDASQSAMDVQRLTEAYLWDFDENIHGTKRLQRLELRPSDQQGSRVAQHEVVIRRESDGPGPGVVAVVIRTGANDLPIQWTGQHVGNHPAGARACVRVELVPGRPWPRVSMAASAKGQFRRLPALDELDEAGLRELLQSGALTIGARAGSRPLCWDPIHVNVDEVSLRRNLYAPRKAKVLAARLLHERLAKHVLWPRDIRTCAIRIGGHDWHSGFETMGPDELELE